MLPGYTFVCTRHAGGHKYLQAFGRRVYTCKVPFQDHFWSENWEGRGLRPLLHTHHCCNLNWTQLTQKLGETCNNKWWLYRSQGGEPSPAIILHHVWGHWRLLFNYRWMLQRYIREERMRHTALSSLEVFLKNVFTSARLQPNIEPAFCAAIVYSVYHPIQSFLQKLENVIWNNLETLLLDIFEEFQKNFDFYAMLGTSTTIMGKKCIFLFLVHRGSLWLVLI